MIMSERWYNLGCAVYRQSGQEPSDDDEPIGILDTPDLAELVVRAVNGQNWLLLTGGRT